MSIPTVKSRTLPALRHVSLAGADVVPVSYLSGPCGFHDGPNRIVGHVVGQDEIDHDFR